MIRFKRILAYFAVIAIAVGAGSVIASIGNQIPTLAWLAISPTFGFEPFNINLVIFDFTFGLNIHLSVAHIITLIITFFVAPKVVATLVKPPEKK